VLAIEQDRKNKANQTIGESKKIFTKNDSYFEGVLKKYIPTEENAEEIPDESKEIVSTVKQLLQKTLVPVITALNATLSKEETNASGIAKAELKVGDTTFGTFSATALLALESYLFKILELYKTIPTLDATRKYDFDEQYDFYRTGAEVKFRSIKRPKVVVKYEATEHHPAQTELINIDFQVGKYETVYFSGKITPTQKVRLVRRFEELIEAVKIARSKANNVEAQQVKLGQEIFDYVHEDII